MQLGLSRAATQPGDLEAEIHQLKFELLAIDRQMNGNRSKRKIGEKNSPTIYDRLGAARSGVDDSTYGPTPTHIHSLELAEKGLTEIKSKLLVIMEQKIPAMKKKLKAAGAPEVE
jgi:hypothetical protein